MRPPTRLLATTVAVLAVTVPSVAGCASGGGSPTPSRTPSRPSSAATASTLGKGFYDPATPPPPEGTITPAPGSWDHAHPPRGYRVVLLTAGSDRPTRTLSAAVDAWAGQEHVSLTTLRVPTSARLIPEITRALAMHPDLIVSTGDDLVDALATVTASSLDQQFLVLGAELAEPTGNVTAADWKGASFRGEGLGQASHYDPASFTAERAGRALRAGVAAVVNHVTGIVVWVS